MVEVNATNAGAVAAAVKAGRAGDAGPSTVRRSASIAALAAAMVKAQAAIEDPTKNKRADAGGRGSYRYADLPTVLDVVRPALSANGLAVMQFPCECDGVPAVTTLLAHTSGEWVETVACLRPVKADPQGVGSALTYMRRFSLLSLCGIAADDDDDGAAASKPAAQQQQKPAAPPALVIEHENAFNAAKDAAAVNKVIAAVRADIEAGRIDDRGIKYLQPVKDKALQRTAAKQPA